MTGTIIETIHQGIQTVLAPREGGQLAAGLLFRVGRADETLSNSGITHLIEHLALHEHGASDLQYNGSTEMVLTGFYVGGSEDDLVRYLNGVCAALNDLPLERLETEKRILRTESSTRGAPSSHSMTRHGAQGYGLSSFDEIGLANASAERVSAWAAHWFTRQNAVLWITSDAVPDGLHLTLGDGARIAPPEPRTVLADTPAWYQGAGAETVLDAIVERSTKANLFAAVLDKRLFRELRVEGGLCYVAAADYVPLDHRSARITATADADPDQLGAVPGGFVDVLAGLRFGTIEQSELDMARASFLRMLGEPDLDGTLLPGYASNLLLGRPNLTRPELVEELNATTVDDLREVADQVWADALVRIPTSDLSWSGAMPTPRSSEVVIEGTEYPSLAYDGSALLVGTDGVSLEEPGWRETVRYEDAVAALQWPDGARMLIDSNGSSVMIEPTIYPLSAEDLALMDGATAHYVRVTMPRRESGEIPQPPELESVPVPELEPTRAERATAKFFAVLLYVIGAFILSAVLITELQPQTRGQDTGNVIGATALSLAALATAVWLGRRGRAP